MVFCGKPSRACLECRVKRRKCDLSKPSCGQCVRAQSTCSGYRDQVELAFRDQSMDVVRRARSSDNQPKRSTRAESSNASSIARKPFPQTITTKDVEKHLGRAVHASLTFPTENQAASFFFHHYLANDPMLSTNKIDCLALIFGRSSANSYLFSIIEAIGIASLANLKKAPNLMCAASRKYSVALEKLRVGLAEPAEAISDQMLICVLLFFIWETVACTVIQSISSGTSHLNGALTLLQLRGLNQLKTMEGRFLFGQVRTELVSLLQRKDSSISPSLADNRKLISCLQRNVPVPQIMRNWMSEAQKLEDSDNMVFSSLANIVADICAFRWTIGSQHNTEYVDKSGLQLSISEASSLDAQLVEWSTSLPFNCNYTTIKTAVEGEDLHLGLYHLYPGFWIAYLWNLYRCARILLNQTLARLLVLNLRLTPSVPKESPCKGSLDASYAAIQECSTSILLSAPFVLGDIRRGQDTSSNLQAAWGVSMLWPLYIAGTSCPTQRHLRQGAIVQLEKIGNTAGVQKARILAAMLRGLGDVEESRQQIEMQSTKSQSVEGQGI